MPGIEGVWWSLRCLLLGAFFVLFGSFVKTRSACCLSLLRALYVYYGYFVRCVSTRSTSKPGLHRAAGRLLDCRSCQPIPIESSQRLPNCRAFDIASEGIIDLRAGHASRAGLLQHAAQIIR